jgi:hypothetical protein
MKGEQMKSRNIKVALAASAITITSLLGATATTAYAHDGQSKNKTAPSAEQIAKHQADRKLQLQTKLDAGVKAGTITQVQSDAIVAFFETDKPNSPPNKDLTKEERRAEKDARKAKINEFAEKNGISQDFLKSLKPQKGGPGARGK